MNTLYPFSIRLNVSLISVAGTIAKAVEIKINILQWYSNIYTLKGIYLNRIGLSNFYIIL